MFIEVTQEDIDNGTRHSATCPVSLAVGRIALCECHSSYAIMLLSRCPEGSIYVTAPVTVTDFITRFDDGLPVNPFSFEIDISTTLRWKIGSILRKLFTRNKSA